MEMSRTMRARSLSTLTIIILLFSVGILVISSPLANTPTSHAKVSSVDSVSNNSTIAASNLALTDLARGPGRSTTTNSLSTSSGTSLTTTLRTSTASEGGGPGHGGRDTSTTSILKTGSTTTSTYSTQSNEIVSANWNPYTDFYSFLNYGLFDDGGDCLGFTNSAILYFVHYNLGDQTYPYYPQATDSLSSLTGDTDSSTLTQPTFPIYIHQTYDPNNHGFVPLNQQSEVQLLVQDIQKGTPVTLVVGPSNFHAIVAWGYNQLPDGNLIIDVSDPNFGNQPRYAYYTNGLFTYTGSYTWTTFGVVTPEMLQWDWFSTENIVGTVESTNTYYNYIFANVPITIVGESGAAFFAEPGNTLSFSNTIKGVVGFEEGSLQAYGIPKEVSFTIQDPGETSSLITILIPQNQSSMVGYLLSSTSTVPLNMSIFPSNDRLNITTSTNVRISVAFFWAGETTHSILNTTSVPVDSSQTAIFSVPNWGNLSDSHTPPNLQVLEADGKLITSQTLTNIETSPPSNLDWLYLISASVIAVAFISIGLLILNKKTNHTSSKSRPQ